MLWFCHLVALPISAIAGPSFRRGSSGIVAAAFALVALAAFFAAGFPDFFVLALGGHPNPATVHLFALIGFQYPINGALIRIGLPRNVFTIRSARKAYPLDVEDR
jgi:hypothetical protein